MLALRHRCQHPDAQPTVSGAFCGCCGKMGNSNQFYFEANGFLFVFLTVTSTFPLFKWSLSHIPHPINVGVTEKGGRLLMDEL